MIDIDMFKVAFLPIIEKEITKDKKIQDKIIEHGFSWYMYGRNDQKQEFKKNIEKLLDIN